MWINITKDVFQHSSFKDLNYLYQILSWKPSLSNKPRYNIVVDTEKVKEYDNYKKLNAIEESLTELLDIEYNAFVTNGKLISHRISSIKNKINYNIEEAVLFFNQPVSIILENNRNDSEFILTIIKKFGNKDGVNDALEHINNSWLQFENAGGCTNIPNFIESFLSRYKEIAKKNNRLLSDYFRGIIILDSDKDYENQEINSSHKAIINKIAELGINTNNIINDETGEILNQNINFHLLEKKMMENYLPRIVFEEIYRQRSVRNNNDLKEWLEVYLNLTSKEQFDFVNIPDGFPPKDNKFDGSSRKSVAQEILSLFEFSLNDLNFKRLDKGFNFKGFDRLGNLNKSRESSFKNIMPNYFRKEYITKENLEERDGKGEINVIMEKIYKLL